MELHEAEQILRDVPRHGDLDQAAARMFAEQAALRLRVSELRAILRGEESTIEELRDELDAARARIAAVRALHHEGVDSARGELIGDGECAECEQHWPCVTIRALNG